MTVFFGDPDAAALGTDPAPASSPGWMDSLASIFKSTSSAVNTVASKYVQPGSGYQPGYIPPLGPDGKPMWGVNGYPSEPTPVWVYIAVPVAAIGLLVVLKKVLRKRKSVSGYRRRNRRSRR